MFEIILRKTSEAIFIIEYLQMQISVIDCIVNIEIHFYFYLKSFEMKSKIIIC